MLLIGNDEQNIGPVILPGGILSERPPPTGRARRRRRRSPEKIPSVHVMLSWANDRFTLCLFYGADRSKRVIGRCVAT